MPTVTASHEKLIQKAIVADKNFMKVKPYTIDLSEQMAVCDANYIRLLKLLGDAHRPNRRSIALPHVNPEERIVICLEVVESFKYTSTIRISQDISSYAGRPAFYAPPEMTVRVYHDANTAEVTSYQNHRNFKAIYPVPNRFMYQSDEKEQLNLFLAEWLSLCLNEGLGNLEKMSLGSLTCQEDQW